MSVLELVGRQARQAWAEAAGEGSILKSYWLQCDFLVLEENVQIRAFENIDWTEKNNYIVVLAFARPLIFREMLLKIRQ